MKDGLILKPYEQMNLAMTALKEEVGLRKFTMEQMFLNEKVSPEIEAALAKSLEEEVNEVLEIALMEFFMGLQETYGADLNEDQQREVLRRANSETGKTDFQGMEESYISYAAILKEKSE